MMEVEVEALPTELPEKIEVNVEKLSAVGEQILVSDIKAPEGVTILSDAGQVVFKVGELITKEMEEQMAADEAAAAAATEAAQAEAGVEGEAKEGETTEGEAKVEGEPAEDKGADAKEEKPADAASGEPKDKKPSA